MLLIGILTILGNLLADLLNSALDPRASYEVNATMTHRADERTGPEGSRR